MRNGGTSDERQGDSQGSESTSHDHLLYFLHLISWQLPRTTEDTMSVMKCYARSLAAACGHTTQACDAATRMVLQCNPPEAACTGAQSPKNLTNFNSASVCFRCWQQRPSDQSSHFSLGYRLSAAADFGSKIQSRQWTSKPARQSFLVGRSANPLAQISNRHH